MVDILHTKEGTTISPGGAIANTIIRLQQLGNTTGFIGRIGQDQHGQAVQEDFRKNNVDISFLHTTSEPTTHSLITVSENESNQTQVNHFSPLHFTPEVDRYIQAARSLFVGPEKAYNFPHVTMIARNHNIPLFVTLFDVKPDSQLDMLLEADICVLFANEKEFTLLGDLAEGLLGKGTIIVETKGKNGCTVYTQKETTSFSGKPVKAKDPTGAGDAFAAGFIHGTLRGWSLERTAVFANAIGALATTSYGARTAEVTQEKVEQMLEESYGH